MLEFVDWTPQEIASVVAPTLIIIGDRDVVRPEHAVEMFRLLPHAKLAVLPDTDHATIVQDAERAQWQVSVIERFLNTPVR
jgi:pimeloyl-ACP methyl ester carboxylesterase